MTRSIVVAVVCVAGLVAACGTGDPDDDETRPASDSSTPTPSAPADAAVVTFRVVDEEFTVELTTPELVDHAERLLAGEQIATIPVGTVIRDDPGVNAPWSWHLDPASVEFADVTIEVCDGLPSSVEDGTVTSDTYCPWSAEIIAVDPTN